MARCPSSVEKDVSAFFERCGLPRDTRSRCWALARGAFPNEYIEESNPQGYCSYTLCIGQDIIVQFRPTVHQLNIKLTTAAQSIYGGLAPHTRLLSIIDVPRSCSLDDFSELPHDKLMDEAVVIDDGCYSHVSLHVYSMARIPGLSVAELRASWTQSSPPLAELRCQREDIIRQFANFIIIGWKSSRSALDPTILSLSGRIGGSISWRVQEMRAHLPRRFQPAVKSALERLDDIESLPWVLTHGDVVPANIMVRNTRVALSGEVVLTGFLDWAEAEYLPFGIGFYGVEALLGEPDRDGRFSYYPEAKELRESFWLCLEAEIPELRVDHGLGNFRRKVEAAHALGVLLWHGIAFDNGKLDRVVDEERPEDAEEVRILDLFFASHAKARNKGVESERSAEPDSSRLDKPFDLGRAFPDI